MIWFIQIIYKILKIIDCRREKEIKFLFYELIRYFIIYLIDRYELDGKYLVIGLDDGYVIVVDGRAFVNFKLVGYISEFYVFVI